MIPLTSSSAPEPTMLPVTTLSPPITLEPTPMPTSVPTTQCPILTNCPTTTTTTTTTIKPKIIPATINIKGKSCENITNLKIDEDGVNKMTNNKKNKFNDFLNENSDSLKNMQDYYFDSGM